MNLKRMLEDVAASFVRLRSCKDGSGSRTGAFDAAVAEVSLMIAALDGTLLPEEFAAYRWTVGRCSGFSEEERQTRLDAAVCKAGRLLMMAQVGAYSEAERLSVFDEIIDETMPSDFWCGSQADVRRSFVLWLSMAFSDGQYSGIERQAIGLLHSRLDPCVALDAGFFETAERLLADMGESERRADAEKQLDQLVVFTN